MAYYHQSVYPSKPPAPESPVPSYQSASHGSTTSPGGSMSSGGFTDHSTPPSPSSDTYEPQWPLTPVVSTDGGPQTIMVVEEHSDDEGEVEDFKTEIDVARQHGANNRALALLEAHAGKGESVKEYKNTLDTTRESWANNRAIALLEATAGARVSGVARATSCSQVHKTGTGTNLSGALTAKQAAAIKYEQRLKQKAKLKQEQKKYTKSTQSIEKLAETTRKPGVKTADDVRDPETVPGMKCQLDLEREIWARKKANKTMESLRHRSHERFA